MKDTVRVNPTKPAQHGTAAAADEDEELYDKTATAPTGGAGRKRNVSVADEIRGKDRKSRIARNARDSDLGSSEEDAEKMEL